MQRRLRRRKRKGDQRGYSEMARDRGCRLQDARRRTGKPAPFYLWRCFIAARKLERHSQLGAKVSHPLVFVLVYEQTRADSACNGALVAPFHRRMARVRDCSQPGE